MSALNFSLAWPRAVLDFDVPMSSLRVLTGGQYCVPQCHIRKGSNTQCRTHTDTEAGTASYTDTDKDTDILTGTELATDT